MAQTPRQQLFRILAIDVGGTTTRFGTFVLDLSSGKPSLQLTSRVDRPTASVSSFSDLLAGYSSTLSADFDSVVIAAAGPVIGGRCTPPNIPWIIDLSQVVTSPLPPTKLMNDLEAQGRGVTVLTGRTQAQAVNLSASTVDLVVGKSTVPSKRMSGVIAIGTGFGRASIFESEDGQLHFLPSEAGHTVFPVVDKDDEAIVLAIQSQGWLGAVTWEALVSGPGLQRIEAHFAGAVQPTVSASTDSGNPHRVSCDAKRALAKYLGRACREFAFEQLPFGGISLLGGVIQANRSMFDDSTFRDEFLRSDVHQDLLSQFSVTMINSDELGLWGAASSLLKDERRTESPLHF